VAVGTILASPKKRSEGGSAEVFGIRSVGSVAPMLGLIARIGSTRVWGQDRDEEPPPNYERKGLQFFLLAMGISGQMKRRATFKRLREE
jgi:hypothetical protein